MDEKIKEIEERYQLNIEKKHRGHLVGFKMVENDMEYLLSRIKELETIISETKRKKTDEEVIKMWDTWREYIANGGTASWPRDAFESIISWYEERIKDLEGKVNKLTLSKQDAEGQLEILRPEYCGLQEKIKELVEGIEGLPRNKIEKAQRVMRENNFIIDNLDDRWQKLCFTFYTDICDMQTKIEELYKLIEKEKP